MLYAVKPVSGAKIHLKPQFALSATRGSFNQNRGRIVCCHVTLYHAKLCNGWCHCHIWPCLALKTAKADTRIHIAITNIQLQLHFRNKRYQNYLVRFSKRSSFPLKVMWVFTFGFTQDPNPGYLRKKSHEPSDPPQYPSNTFMNTRTFRSQARQTVRLSSSRSMGLLDKLVRDWAV